MTSCSLVYNGMGGISQWRAKAVLRRASVDFGQDYVELHRDRLQCVQYNHLELTVIMPTNSTNSQHFHPEILGKLQYTNGPHPCIMNF